MKKDNVHSMRISKGEDREKKGRKNIWKDNSLKLPNLVEYLNLLIQEVQQIPSRIKSKRVPM